MHHALIFPAQRVSYFGDRPLKTIAAPFPLDAQHGDDLVAAFAGAARMHQAAHGLGANAGRLLVGESDEAHGARARVAGERTRRGQQRGDTGSVVVGAGCDARLAVLDGVVKNQARSGEPISTRPKPNRLSCQLAPTAPPNPGLTFASAEACEWQVRQETELTGRRDDSARCRSACRSGAPAAAVSARRPAGCRGNARSARHRAGRGCPAGSSSWSAMPCTAATGPAARQSGRWPSSRTRP